MTMSMTTEEGTGGADQSNRSLRLMELCLRFSVIPLTVASLWVMATDRQVPQGYGKLEYSDISGFKYMISVDAISASYALVAIVLSRLGVFASDWVFYISDQAIAYLMLTSGSAVAEVLFLAYKGSRNASWSEACSYYGRFCNRTKVSLLLHFLALLCFVALAVISAFRVFSKFKAPCAISTTNSTSKENGGQLD